MATNNRSGPPARRPVPGFVELAYMNHESLKREGKLIPDEPPITIALRYLRSRPRSICTLREIHKLMLAVEVADLVAALDQLAAKKLIDKLPAGPRRFNYRLNASQRPVVFSPKSKP